MKVALILVGLLLSVTASAQQNTEQHAKGTIYGIAIDHDGQPAKRIGLVASPLGVALAAKLPHTRTNDAGEYRFENLPWWGRYTVDADDEDAGYSDFSTGHMSDNVPEVEITLQHPEAQLTVVIPPKAGFIQIHLTNQSTGADISGMRVAVMSEKNPTSPLYTTSCYSNKVILVPPDTSLLLHVTSDCFREWKESSGKGKPVHLASGNRLKLDVRLEPLE